MWQLMGSQPCCWWPGEAHTPLSFTELPCACLRPDKAFWGGVGVTGLDSRSIWSSLGTHTHILFFSHTMWSTPESEEQLLNIKLNYRKKKEKKKKGRREERWLAWKQAEKVRSQRSTLEQLQSVWNELIRPLNRSFNLKHPFHFCTL